MVMLFKKCATSQFISLHLLNQLTLMLLILNKLTLNSPDPLLANSAASNQVAGENHEELKLRNNFQHCLTFGAAQRTVSRATVVKMLESHRGGANSGQKKRKLRQ